MPPAVGFFERGEWGGETDAQVSLEELQSVGKQAEPGGGRKWGRIVERVPGESGPVAEEGHPELVPEFDDVEDFEQKSDCAGFGDGFAAGGDREGWGWECFQVGGSTVSNSYNQLKFKNFSKLRIFWNFVFFLFFFGNFRFF